LQETVWPLVITAWRLLTDVSKRSGIDEGAEKCQRWLKAREWMK